MTFHEEIISSKYGDFGTKNTPHAEGEGSRNGQREVVGEEKGH